MRRKRADGQLLWGDTEARLEQLINSHAARTTRYALSEAMNCFVRDKRRKYGHSPRVTVQELAGLQEVWAKRVRWFASREWGPVADDKGYSFACNCPPPGVLIRKWRLRPCCIAVICPWCWCRRYVQPAFYRLSSLIFPNGEDVAPDYDIVLTQTMRKYPVTRGFDLLHLLRWIRDCKSNYYKHCLLPDAVGGVSLCAIEPPEPSDPEEAWRLSHRVIAAIPHTKRTAESPEPLSVEEQNAGARAWRNEQRLVAPRVSTLVPFIGKFGQYPAQLSNRLLTQAI